MKKNETEEQQNAKRTNHTVDEVQNGFIEKQQPNILNYTSGMVLLLFFYSVFSCPLFTVTIQTVWLHQYDIWIEW